MINLILDSIYSRLFSLKQYSNGENGVDYPSFDDNIYEQYLIIYKELKTIDSYLELNNISYIQNLYDNERKTWRGADLDR
jgi:hypothetical protein